MQLEDCIVGQSYYFTRTKHVDSQELIGEYRQGMYSGFLAARMTLCFADEISNIEAVPSRAEWKALRDALAEVTHENQN
jgi:hypothetical protein